MDDAVLVIDAGTSGMRAVRVAGDGAVASSSARVWEFVVPDDGGPFGRELDPRGVMAALDGLVSTASAGAQAIAFTGQREGVAFLDERGDALFVSPNIDGRASAEGMAIDGRIGGDVYRSTGRLPSMIMAPAKLAWLRAHRPAVAARVVTAMPLADWLAMSLTGVRAMSRSLGVEIGLLAVGTGAPDEALLVSLDVARTLVPSVESEGTMVGQARGGMFHGVPVVLGGADTQCALLGMGALDRGDAGVPAGWSAPVQVVTDRLVIDAGRRTWTGLHVAPDRWVLESNAGETGRAWEWVCQMLGVAPDEGFAFAATAPAAANDAMAVLGTRRMNASAMNAGVGAITMPLPFVMSAPTRGDVARAALESIAYAIRANLEQLEEVSGAPLTALRLGGGMSRQPLFAQILADVIGRRVFVAQSAETAAIGAAALVATAIGRYDSLEVAVEAMCVPREVIEPDVGASAQYDDCYGRWCAMADAFATGAW